MSITPQAVRKLRIIALPLTRPRPGVLSSQVLTQYKFQITPPPPRISSTSSERAGEKDGENGGAENKRGWLPEEGVVNWMTGKAANIWAGFGKTKGGWKLKVYQTGEKLVDRLDFEELALKGVDPSLGPSLSRWRTKTKATDEQEEQFNIPLIYPSSFSSDAAALSDLRALLDHRLPRHRRGFYTWMIIAPFTAPFMIIPIIPNLPFFFCAWRSWSHYKAYKASHYLKSLLDHNAIVPQSNDALDVIYKAHASLASEETTSPPPLEKEDANPQNSQTPKNNAKHTLLLTRDAIPPIVDLFTLKQSSTSELYRAVEQARARVTSGRLEL